jgi:predicted PurR-regulated permease PerM
VAARISHTHHPGAIKTVLIALALAALVVLVPMWAPLVLAAWFAHFTRPIVARICQKRLAKRKRAAGMMVLFAVLILLAPLVLIAVSLTSSAVELVDTMMKSKSGGAALKSIVAADGNGFHLGESLKAPEKLVELARQHGTKAWTAINRIAGMTANAIIGFFVFLIGAYTFLVEGETAYKWCEQHVPVRPELFARFARAFNETGRGLLVGVVLTGALQSVIATVAYLVLGVPSALVLGLITFFASLIPSIGTALVWVPVAAGLALSGRTTAAIVLVVLGVAVIGTIDNFLRPMFSRWGKLDMPSFVVLVTMFGGLAVFGAWGLVLGPLIVRLFIEALRIAREERLTGAHTTLSPPKPSAPPSPEERGRG